MTPRQIQLVKASFAKVQPQPGAVAAQFYARLFELDPNLRALFKGDMQAQGRKLMQMIGTAVGALDRLGTVLPDIVRLGERHVRYGVQDAHYATVGAALLWTLQQGLGAEFTPEVEAAWTEVYSVLATTMQNAARAVS